jgi:hypothetical protein
MTCSVGYIHFFSGDPLTTVPEYMYTSPYKVREGHRHLVSTSRKVLYDKEYTGQRDVTQYKRAILQAFGPAPYALDSTLSFVCFTNEKESLYWSRAKSTIYYTAIVSLSEEPPSVSTFLLQVVYFVLSKQLSRYGYNPRKQDDIFCVEFRKLHEVFKDVYARCPDDALLRIAANVALLIKPEKITQKRINSGNTAFRELYRVIFEDENGTYKNNPLFAHNVILRDRKDNVRRDLFNCFFMGERAKHCPEGTPAGHVFYNEDKLLYVPDNFLNARVYRCPNTKMYAFSQNSTQAFWRIREQFIRRLSTNFNKYKANGMKNLLTVQEKEERDAFTDVTLPLDPYENAGPTHNQIRDSIRKHGPLPGVNTTIRDNTTVVGGELVSQVEPIEFPEMENYLAQKAVYTLDPDTLPFRSVSGPDFFEAQFYESETDTYRSLPAHRIRRADLERLDTIKWLSGLDLISNEVLDELRKIQGYEHDTPQH